MIHYCWFGKNPLPQLSIKCIESWKTYLPEYEIKEWNEDNFDINIISYTKQAYENRKYAFVSDYARFWILYQYGGVYFDTDVEIIKPMSDIIDKGAFMGCETDYDIKSNRINNNVHKFGLSVNPGLGLAADPHMAFYKQLLDLYSSLSFYNDDGLLNISTVVEYTTRLLFEKGLNNISDFQKIEGIYIYPKEYFNPKSPLGIIRITKNTYSIHHFSASWLTPYQRLKNKLVTIFQLSIIGRFFLKLYHKIVDK